MATKENRMKKILLMAIVLSSVGADSLTPYSYRFDYGKESTKKSEIGYGVYGSYNLNSFFME